MLILLLFLIKIFIVFWDNAKSQEIAEKSKKKNVIMPTILFQFTKKVIYSLLKTWTFLLHFVINTGYSLLLFIKVFNFLIKN